MKLNITIDCVSDMSGFKGVANISEGEGEDGESVNIYDILYMSHSIFHALQLLYARMAEHITDEGVTDYPDPTSILLYADLLHDMMNSINVKLSAEGLLQCSCDNEVTNDSKESFIQFTNNWNPSQLN